MSFHIKYRPKDFDEILGNKDTIRSLKALFEKEDVPHTFLFHGSSGCGKTTFARIIANKLGCSDFDFKEINAGNNRGIDTAREIIKNIHYSPIQGKTKVILIDECFAKNTLIKTKDGDKKIQNVSIGDTIYNIEGETKVSNVFHNRIPLYKVMKINFNNNTEIFCSTDHLFLTDFGWKKAKDLTKKELFLEYNPSAMINNKQLKNFKKGTEYVLSNKLQSGYRKQEIENSNRDRRELSQLEKASFERQEKREKTKRIRVENIEIYKQGSNDESFKSVVTNKERDQNFIEFYDLEIEGHPSYYVNNILVHNCHQTTKDFQNTLLKPLEDTPGHVYFILCTTNPEKLLPTIRNRCAMFEVNALTDKSISKLLNQVCEEEKREVKKEVIEKIINKVEGCPRQALILLEQIIFLSEEHQLKAIKHFKTQEEKVIDLCRAILKKEPWNKITKILKGIEEEPESVRRAVLGYMNSVMLNNENPHCVLVYNIFKTPFYDTGKAGLTFSSYLATKYK